MVTSADPVISAASRIALELYPLYLIKLPASNSWLMGNFFNLFLLVYRLGYRKILIDEIMKDSSMSKLFTMIGENEMDTSSQYMSSAGRGGGIQLAVFPDTLIANACELMKLRGEISQEALIKCVEETVQMLRDIGEGKQIDVPVFVGFHNVGLDDLSGIELEWGKIRPYYQELIDLIPHEARPSTSGEANKFLGLVVESKYPYKVILGPNLDYSHWPSELEQGRKKLEISKENLSFTLALAIDRTPPLGITQAWTLIFDPLSQGTSISWNFRANSPVPHYLLRATEREAIVYWSELIANSNDEKIRIAIRRILSAINDRLNPIDGFVDTIIAWENLFGGNAELSYRISISISKLLKETLSERLEMQSKIVNYYNDRSKVIHGVKDLSYDEAIQKRNECLTIALAAIKKLYQEYNKLLTDPDRSKKLALL